MNFSTFIKLHPFLTRERKERKRRILDVVGLYVFTNDKDLSGEVWGGVAQLEG